MTDIIDFGPVKQNKSIIKVIGVGGGGGNAVNHMYREGVHDVSFVLCNTDAQALADSPVPIHLQLGKEGLGAGNRPQRAREAAEESIDEIRHMLNDGTRMAFITAGMGGGTGTGAAPVIARESRALDILTVGIVTIPFKFEGARKINQALDGVEEMAKNVDALLVINNERLRSIYGELSMMEAFAKADDTLSVAAKSIAEIITVHGTINLDFNDVKTVLKDGGVAIMSTGYGEGDDDADNKGLMMDEMNDINDFMDQFGPDFELKWGTANDPSLGDKVKITILATGFGIADINEALADRVRSKKTPEELAKEAEEEERRQRMEERRIKYYGSDGNGMLKKKPHKIFVFTPEDLDDDDLILAVENTPSAQRTRTQLENLNNHVYTA